MDLGLETFGLCRASDSPYIIRIDVACLIHRRNGLAEGLSHERPLIEIPADINALERRSNELTVEWREATRWAFTESLKSNFFVAEYCRTIRGKQGPGAYILEKGSVTNYIPELG